MTVNVHDLIDLPYGQAQAAIKKAGLWKPLDGELTKYNVTVRKEYRDDEYVVIKVEANSEDEAKEIAVEEALSDDDEAVAAIATKAVLA